MATAAALRPAASLAVYLQVAAWGAFVLLATAAADSVDTTVAENQIEVSGQNSTLDTNGYAGVNITTTTPSPNLSNNHSYELRCRRRAQLLVDGGVVEGTPAFRAALRVLCVLARSAHIGHHGAPHDAHQGFRFGNLITEESFDASEYQSLNGEDANKRFDLVFSDGQSSSSTNFFGAFSSTCHYHSTRHLQHLQHQLRLEERALRPRSLAWLLAARLACGSAWGAQDSSEEQQQGTRSSEERAVDAFARRVRSARVGPAPPARPRPSHVDEAVAGRSAKLRQSGPARVARSPQRANARRARGLNDNRVEEAPAALRTLPPLLFPRSAPAPGHSYDIDCVPQGELLLADGVELQTTRHLMEVLRHICSMLRANSDHPMPLPLLRHRHDVHRLGYIITRESFDPREYQRLGIRVDVEYADGRRRFGRLPLHVSVRCSGRTPRLVNISWQALAPGSLAWGLLGAVRCGHPRPTLAPAPAARTDDAEVWRLQQGSLPSHRLRSEDRNKPRFLAEQADAKDPDRAASAPQARSILQNPPDLLQQLSDHAESDGPVPVIQKVQDNVWRLLKTPSFSVQNQPARLPFQEGGVSAGMEDGNAQRSLGKQPPSAGVPLRTLHSDSPHTFQPESTSNHQANGGAESNVLEVTRSEIVQQNDPVISQDRPSYSSSQSSLLSLLLRAPIPTERLHDNSVGATSLPLLPSSVTEPLSPEVTSLSSTNFPSTSFLDTTPQPQPPQKLFLLPSALPSTQSFSSELSSNKPYIPEYSSPVPLSDLTRQQEEMWRVKSSPAPLLKYERKSWPSLIKDTTDHNSESEKTGIQEKDHDLVNCGENLPTPERLDSRLQDIKVISHDYMDNGQDNHYHTYVLRCADSAALEVDGRDVRLTSHMSAALFFLCALLSSGDSSSSVSYIFGTIRTVESFRTEDVAVGSPGDARLDVLYEGGALPRNLDVNIFWQTCRPDPPGPEFSLDSGPLLSHSIVWSLFSKVRCGSDNEDIFPGAEQYFGDDTTSIEKSSEEIHPSYSDRHHYIIRCAPGQEVLEVDGLVVRVTAHMESALGLLCFSAGLHGHDNITRNLGRIRTEEVFNPEEYNAARNGSKRIDVLYSDNISRFDERVFSMMPECGARPARFMVNERELRAGGLLWRLYRALLCGGGHGGTGRQPSSEEELKESMDGEDFRSPLYVSSNVHKYAIRCRRGAERLLVDGVRVRATRHLLAVLRFICDIIRGSSPHALSPAAVFTFGDIVTRDTFATAEFASEATVASGRSFDVQYSQPTTVSSQQPTSLRSTCDPEAQFILDGHRLAPHTVIWSLFHSLRCARGRSLLQE